MLHSFEQDSGTGVLDSAVPPCLSLYQPTHRRFPENAQDPIRFRNLIRTLSESLRSRYRTAAVETLMEPFHRLAADDEFWRNTRDGLVVLSAADLFRVYLVDHAVEELAVVGDTFHTKPLVRLQQSAQRYQILGLTRTHIRLFAGDRESLHEVELAPGVARTMVDALGPVLSSPGSTVASYGGVGVGKGPMHHGSGSRADEIDKDVERFFRRVDHDIMAFHADETRVPLILLTLKEHRDMFERISRNPRLLPYGINANPDAIALDELRAQAWGLFAPYQDATTVAHIESLQQASAHGLADLELESVARAIAAGRVATLMIDGDRAIPGRVDRETGRVTAADRSEPDVNDVLTDLGSMARARGGRLLVMPGAVLPGDSGVAAILRY